MTKLILKLLLYISLFSPLIFGASIPFKADLASHYPGITFSNVTLPHMYRVSLHYHKDLKPYIYYGQDNKLFELGFGSLLNHSFQDRLYYNAYFDSGIYLKSTLDPISLKYFVMPSNHYLSLTFKELLGVSYLVERYSEKVGYDPFSKNTLSLFGKVSFASIQLDGAISAVENNNTTSSGHTLGVSLPFVVGSVKNSIGIHKINWANPIAPPNYSQPENYLIEFYRALSGLRHLNIDTYYTSYDGEIPLDNIAVLVDLHHVNDPELYLVSFGFKYKIDDHLGLYTKVYKSSNEPSFLVLFNFIVVHHLGV